MYIEDGSRQDYDKVDIPNRYSWGWLGDKVPNCGWDDHLLKQRVLSKIAEMSKDHVVMCHCGFHACEICQAQGGPEHYDNGSFVIDWDGLQFRCPVMVGHYISEHDYFPGQKVMDALFGGEWFSAAEEDRQLKQQLDRRMQENREREEREERERLSKMTPEEISEEQAKRAYAKSLAKFAAVKVEQLRANGAFVELE
jgi:hypothetical protein